jgi:hypothetical protein
LGPPNPAEVEKEKKQSFLASHWKSIWPLVRGIAIDIIQFGPWL